MKNASHLRLFFLATFVATWTTYFTIVFQGWSPYAMPGLALFLVGGSAPSWVGVLMVLFTYTPAARRDYFRRCFAFRQIKGAEWAFMLFLFPGLFVFIMALNGLLGGSLPGMTNLKAFIAQPGLIPLALVIGFFSGPWSEEFGWRGYALDPLLDRFGVLRGSFLLGIIWGGWHLPLFFMPQTWHGQMGFRLAGFWTFMLYSIGLAMTMSWVYLRTNRAILTGFLLHFASNFTGNLFAPYSDQFEIMRMVVIILLGFALCMRMASHLDKPEPKFQPPRREEHKEKPQETFRESLGASHLGGETSYCL